MSNIVGDMLKIRQQTITKTRQYSFDPIKPYFYTVKLGFTGVHINFLISTQKKIVGTRKNRLAEAVLTRTHNLCFGAEI